MTRDVSRRESWAPVCPWTFPLVLSRYHSSRYSSSPCVCFTFRVPGRENLLAQTETGVCLLHPLRLSQALSVIQCRHCYCSPFRGSLSSGQTPQERSINVVSTNNWVTAVSTLSLTGSSSLEDPGHSFDRSAFISFLFLVQITFIQQTFTAHLVSVRSPATSWGHKEIKPHPWV